jgi:hypothetical protein
LLLLGGALLNEWLLLKSLGLTLGNELTTMIFSPLIRAFSDEVEVIITIIA